MCGCMQPRMRSCSTPSVMHVTAMVGIWVALVEGVSCVQCAAAATGPPCCHIALLPTRQPAGGVVAYACTAVALQHTHFLYTYFSLICRGVSSSRSAGVTSSQGTRRDACDGPAVAWLVAAYGWLCNAHQHILVVDRLHSVPPCPLRVPCVFAADHKVTNDSCTALQR